MRGAGRVVFAATLLLIVGTLNIIYGIGALDDANIFVNDQRFILTNLNTLGWVLIILGVIQLTGGFSLMAGNTYGRVIGIIGGSLGAIGALLSIGGAYPWWSLAMFALCVYVVHGIMVYGEDERGQKPELPDLRIRLGQSKKARHWRAFCPARTSFEAARPGRARDPVDYDLAARDLRSVRERLLELLLADPVRGLIRVDS